MQQWYVTSCAHGVSTKKDHYFVLCSSLWESSSQCSWVQSFWGRISALGGIFSKLKHQKYKTQTYAKLTVSVNIIHNFFQWIFCSLIGAVIIVVGFYAVLWGKYREEKNSEKMVENLESPSCHNVPLLENRA